MNQNKKTDEEIEIYKNIKADFTDYIHFEDDAKRRDVERYSFINNIEYTPNYKYPKLDFLIDDTKLEKKKTNIEIVPYEKSKIVDDNKWSDY